MARTFRFDETRDVLYALRELSVHESGAALTGLGDVAGDETGGEKEGDHAGSDGARARVVVHPPLVQAVPAGCASVKQYVDSLTDDLGAHLVLLMQAGAASLGWFEDGEAVRTKTVKKYVVRGRGKAQPTHLETKGKSRYGSRLRLQNAKALLVEINERLTDWFEEYGTPERIFYSCPVRTWPELFSTKPPPPFAQEDATKIPLDLPVPTTDVMVRTYKRLTYGRVEAAPVS